MAGVVMSVVVVALPDRQRYPPKVPKILLAMGGFGTEMALGEFFLRTFGGNDFTYGAKKWMTGVFKKREYRLAVIVVGTILTALVTVILTFLDIDIHLCVSLLRL
jgi:hypothetical protein